MSFWYWQLYPSYKGRRSAEDVRFCSIKYGIESVNVCNASSVAKLAFSLLFITSIWPPAVLHPLLNSLVAVLKLITGHLWQAWISSRHAMVAPGSLIGRRSSAIPPLDGNNFNLRCLYRALRELKCGTNCNIVIMSTDKCRYDDKKKIP
jgi:hypothetical protein